MATTTNISTGLEGDWDDSELIKAYDKAVKKWDKPKAELEKTPQITPGPGPWVSVSVTAPDGGPSRTIEMLATQSNALNVANWIIGSPCRAIWSEDGVEYEAKIISLEGPLCNIRFVGYGNQENKQLTDLKDTFGKRSRDRQRRDAQILNISTNADMEIEEYYSSVSLTSSMYNNCNDSIVREREEEHLTTGECSGHPRSSTLSASALPRNQLLSRNYKQKSPNKRKRDDARDEATETMTLDTVELDSEHASQIDPLEKIEDAVLPSAAEATIGSSSDDSSIGDDGDDEAEATSAGPYGDAMKSFPSMVPRFPIPPMPMSLAGEDGKFDFGRGQLPSLLLSWYMSGYHSGYYDARQEIATGTSKNPIKTKEEKLTRSKRQ